MLQYIHCETDNKAVEMQYNVFWAFEFLLTKLQMAIFFRI